MKQFIKSALIITLALVMMVSSLIVVAAEGSSSSDDGKSITVSTEGDAPRAYELIWKYKYHDGHLYKRRWNATLNCWYDPEWILVQ